MDQPTESPRFRFSIRGVLLVTALCAVAAAPVGWLGTGYAFSAGVSLLLLGVAARAIARQKFAAGVVVCLVAIVASALLFSSGLFLQAIATLVVFLLSLSVPDRVRPLVATCVAVMLLAYVPMFRYAMASDRRIDAMRERWPLVSLRDNLPSQPEADPLVPVSLSSEQTLTIEDREKSISYRGLSNQLERIHRDSYKKFARAPGFGFIRMGPITTKRLEYVEVEHRPGAIDPLPILLSRRADDAKPDELHEASQAMFLESDRVGYVESIDRVAGFQGHGFSHPPYDERRSSREEERSGRWRLDRLDLIGLVLHEEPVAYVSGKLPNMEELRDAPTRPLEDFESEALEKLRGQEDLVIEEPASEGEAHLRMVGAIRAGHSCAVCHEVPYGTLLGAFSYDLTKLPNQIDSLPHEPASTR